MKDPHKVGLLLFAALVFCTAIFFLFTFSVCNYYGIGGGYVMGQRHRYRNHVAPPMVLTFSGAVTVGAVGRLAPPAPAPPPPPLPASKAALHQGWNQAD